MRPAGASWLAQALRSLARDRSYAPLAVAALAIGIGATSAAFTYLASFLWHDKDLFEPDRLVTFVYRTEGTEAIDFEGPIPYPDLLDYQRDGRDAAEVVAMRIFGAPVSIEGGGTVWAWGHAVSERYFEVLGVPLALGRSWSGDAAGDVPRTVVLADRFWRRNFDRDPEVIGRALEIGGQDYRVIGVMPKGFIGTGIPADLYLPLSHAADVLPEIPFHDRNRGTVFAVARLAPGVTIESAESRFAALATALDHDWPLQQGVRRPYLIGAGLSARSLASADLQSGGYFRRSLLILGAAFLLLALTATNVASLLVARLLARRRELAIRAALGASRLRLTVNLLIEGLLIVVPGAVLGIAVSRLLIGVIRRYFVLNPVDLGHWGEGAEVLGLDWRTLLFTVGVSIVATLSLATWPIMRATRGGAVAVFGERSQSPNVAARGRRALVVLQVAMSALLLSGAVLMARSVSRLRAVDPGFDSSNLVVASFALDVARLDETQQREAYHEVEAAAAAIPGVESAALSSFIPLGGGRLTEVHDSGSEVAVSAAYTLVGPSYFSTLRLPLLAGRPLDRERLADARGAVVSANLAAALWPGKDPLDRTVRLRTLNREEAEYRVVGVAADARLLGPIGEPRPAVFLSFDQAFRRQMSVIARCDGPPETLLPLFRKTLERAHPRVALIAAATLADSVDRSLVEQRLQSSMSSIIAVLALLTAASGITSLMGYLVRARRRELAVRTAIGAQPRQLSLHVFREAAAMVVLGAALGLIAAMLSARLLRALLYGVDPLDLVSHATTALVIAGVGLLAALGPALRAARIAPSQALREE